MGKNDINAFLGTGTEYNGRLVFDGSVRIDGKFKGEAESEGTLVVGREADVEGEIVVGEMILNGSFKGEARAKSKVVLGKTARFQGRLNSPVLVIEEGAVLQAEVNMIEDSSARPGSEEDVIDLVEQTKF